MPRPARSRVHVLTSALAMLASLAVANSSQAEPPPDTTQSGNPNVTVPLVGSGAPASKDEPPATAKNELNGSGKAAPSADAQSKVEPPPPPEFEGRKSLAEFKLGQDYLVVGGYFQPAFVYQRNTTFNQEDQDGFVFRNARLLGQGVLPIEKDLVGSFNFNFDVATGVFLVRDVFGSITYGKNLVALDVGQMKTPFMLTELVPESDMQMPTAPLGVRRLSYGRDKGIRLRGEIKPGPVHIGWFGALQNGEGTNVVVNSDSQFLYAGRIEIGPLGKIPLSEPDLQSSPFGFVLGGNAVYTPNVSRNDLGINDAGGKETRWAADLRMRFRGLTLRGEYVRGRHTSSGSNNFDREGFYIQGGYVLPLPIKPKFEIVGRFEQLDLNKKEDGMVVSQAPASDPEALFQGQPKREYSVPDNSKVRRIEFGAGVYIVGHRLKLQATYIMTDYLEGPKTDVKGNPIVGDIFQTQLQFGWL